jgi:hypothetical protein
MDDRTRALLDLAFARARASDANQEIERIRQDQLAASYEVVLGTDESFSGIVDRVVPRLVYHLETQRKRYPGYAGLFLSIFLGDDLYFMHAKDAVDFFAAATGTSTADLAKRFGPSTATTSK